MGTRLHIDWTACRGHGLCTELLPELFDRDPWGYPLARNDLTIPAELEAHAKQAAHLCPRLALSAEPKKDSGGDVENLWPAPSPR